MLVALAVFVFTNVYASEEVDLKIQPSVSFSDASVYSITNPITPISNPYTGNRALGFLIFVIEKENPQYQWECLEVLWTKESNWNHTVWNRQGSGAYGIPQSLPASKMATHGEDYMTNPEVQVRWGVDYIENRYSNSCNALNFWRKNNWY